MPDTFWSFFPSDNREDGFMAEDPDAARQALIAACPQATEWHFGDSGEEPELPLYWLLIAVNYCDFDGTLRKFLPALRVQPEDVTLHTDPDAFREFLYTQPRRGAITFQWNATNHIEDGATQVPTGTRIVKSLYRRIGWDQDKKEYYRPEELTLAVCVLEGTKLEVFAAPHDWNQVVEQVMIDLKRMTAREKAEKDVESALRGFVSLLGKEKVQEALNKL